jgi:dihydropteroate synthase
MGWESGKGSGLGDAPRVPGVNREHGPPRVLELGSLEDLRDEMVRLGVDPAGIAIMLPKGRLLCVRVMEVGFAQANILKQEMLSLGGECAHARGVVTAQSATSDVLLMGTRRHFQRLADKLGGQPFGLGEMATDIASTLDNYTLGCPPPLILPTGALHWGERTYIMGVLNVTPDSFSDGGRFRDNDAAVEHAKRMAHEGAHIIDIGGESTRPGSEGVTLEEELERVLPVVEGVVNGTALPVSIDTSKAEVARRALDMGACMINDVTALRGDPEMAPLAAERCVPVVLMHMLGEPRTMQEAPIYQDVMEELYRFFLERRDFAAGKGIRPDRLVLDPGIGFGKRLEDNVTILARLGEFRGIGLPLMVGTSRKRFIGDLSGAPVEERLPGTLASITAAVGAGADMVRVHDVAAASQALSVADPIFRRSRATI